MSVSFVLWAFSKYSGQTFAFCGKTIASLRRNVILPLLAGLEEMGFSCEEKVSRNTVTLTYGDKSNLFYLFGGRDESSAALVETYAIFAVLVSLLLVLFA